MLDLCPRCRIQAPHRDGRDRCPQCGGPLTVVGSAAEGAAVVAGHRPAAPTPRARAAPLAPPLPTVARPPRTASGAPRMYGSRYVRWVARRPPETLPPVPPARRVVHRAIPRYPYIPRWGLLDTPVSAGSAQSAPARLGAALATAMQIAGAALVASAVAHLLRYVLLVINRSTTLPGWLIVLSTVLVIAGGLAALGGFVYATVLFARWLIAVRAQVYAYRGWTDPRRRWQSISLAVIPLVNVVGAGLLLAEPAELLDDEERAASRERLRKLWVGWAAVNTVAVAAAITWWVSAQSGSIQTGANALFMVVVSAASSAAFAYWAAPRLPKMFAEKVDDETIPARRWVAVA